MPGLRFLFVVLAPLAGVAYAATSKVPSVLEVAKPAPSFRDVSLEQRCDALQAFVRSFAAQHLAPPAAKLETGSCGEGNGLGGARYSLDLKWHVDKGPTRLYWLDVSFTTGGQPQVRLCDGNASPSACSTNDPNAMLHFETRSGRFETPEKAIAAAKAFYALAPNAMHLLPTIAAWIRAKPIHHELYGLDYHDFVEHIVAYDGAFPARSLGGKPTQVRFRLVPDAATPEHGHVKLATPVDADFLKCFKCPDAKCVDDQVTYRFDERFFSLTRQIPEKEKAKGDDAANLAAGWVIEGLTPQTSSAGSWRFACGASRYSIANLRQ